MSEKLNKSTEYREEELFAVLDQYMALSPEELPSREEIERQYPAMAREIWRCLEGMKLLRSEGSSRSFSVDLSGSSTVSEPRSCRKKFLVENTEFPASSSASRLSASGGARKPELMLDMEPIGDFELVREIARGGMGVVYEAWQNSLNRLVALKILPFTATFEERQLLRFRNEASAAAQLEHPGIVPIYAIGCEREIHFYAMKLIHGPHLGAVIRALRQKYGIGGPGGDVLPKTAFGSPESTVRFFRDEELASARFLTDSADPATQLENKSENAEETSAEKPVGLTGAVPHLPTSFMSANLNVSESMAQIYADQRAEYFRFAARLMKQAAEALDYAHQCGVVHRDIKPANLILDVEGRLWITDFGLAQIRSDVELTQTGEVVGTPRYMSPEQAQGNPRLADHRVDIYSLGATFYEFLTLNPIFSETNQVQLLNQIAQEEPKRPRSWQPEIPHDFETILLKCLSKMPADRYATAGELAEDLTRFLDNRPILARRPGFLERVLKWNARHPKSLAFTFLAFLAIWVGTMIHHQIILQEKTRTQDALAEAQARFEKARTAADKLVKIAEEDLAADDSPSVRRVRQKVLDTALVLYQDFLKIDELDPETEQQLTAIRNYVQQFMELLSESNGMPPIFLLNYRNVQADLELTDAQIQEIRRFSWEFQKKGERLFREYRSFTPEDRVNRMMEQIRSSEAFLNQVLTQGQAKRLREIQLQFQPERICDENVRQELQLTEKQAEALENAFAHRRNSMPGNPRPGHRAVYSRSSKPNHQRGPVYGKADLSLGGNPAGPLPSISSEKKDGGVSEMPNNGGDPVSGRSPIEKSSQTSEISGNPAHFHGAVEVSADPQWNIQSGVQANVGPNGPLAGPQNAQQNAQPNAQQNTDSESTAKPSDYSSENGEHKSWSSGREDIRRQWNEREPQREKGGGYWRMWNGRSEIIESILTEEQLKKWNEMKGEPFQWHNTEKKPEQIRPDGPAGMRKISEKL